MEINKLIKASIKLAQQQKLSITIKHGDYFRNLYIFLTIIFDIRLHT